MKIIKVASYEEMSAHAGQIIINKVKDHPSSILGLATGGTPLGTYRRIIEDHERNHTSYRDVSTINLDEYVGLNEDHPQSYHMYMKEHLFSQIDVQPQHTYLPDGTAKDLSKECQHYDQLIEKLGGIDLQLLGIGQNGHIGFNEPGTSFESRTHVIDLMESTRKANARYFSNVNEVPHHAITMGIRSIVESKEILLLASGKKKSSALSRLLEGNVTEEFPASILTRHPQVTLIADEAALSKSQI
ncbi:glucosamine-6-phosphate deaminase 1 [Halobacillus andaensis]|uniref:Glucosamine-6-phosphate deaminase n=1 Tax=Halobacillus andaensis TaxID=1176239 RepID=A0A917B4L3_HALAA|nr:glucosamine-6-phosphate deaminase [Halobacillus andaensis]MBP2004643.1 glucosamine-6-phosphate deaminase [Halobacillus andaensis]GGF20078.1 glucosamine-6-phosphate deaminase 1 [Halobacillus andaensis]